MGGRARPTGSTAEDVLVLAVRQRMITLEEVERISEQLDIHHVNVERDYIFGWLLKAFYENDYLRRTLVFKGGNCLRKAY